MASADKQLYEDLIRVRNQYPRVVEWLDSRLNSHKTALVRLVTAEDIKIAQGRAQEISDLLHVIQHAEQNLR